MSLADKVRKWNSDHGIDHGPGDNEPSRVPDPPAELRLKGQIRPDDIFPASTDDER